MSTVTEIETAIQKLGMADQRLIARHLGERLVGGKYQHQQGDSATDEGIRFLTPFESFPAPRASRAKKPRQRA